MLMNAFTVTARLDMAPICFPMALNTKVIGITAPCMAMELINIPKASNIDIDAYVRCLTKSVSLLILHSSPS